MQTPESQMAKVLLFVFVSLVLPDLPFLPVDYLPVFPLLAAAFLFVAPL